MKTFIPILTSGFNRLLVLCVGLFWTTKISAQIPANDNCNNAVLLTSGTSCTNTTGTVVNATNSGVGVAPCTGNPNNDVWYRFVSVSTDHTITLSNIGANLNTSGPRMQLFIGTCTGLTSVACGTTSISLTTLERNTTYYIRVYSAGGTAITTNGGFRICVTHPAIPTPQIDLGKSFINVSKPNGGTVETNDTLEIRASIVVRSGSFDSCRFTDVVPAGTAYIPGTLRIITNEGLTYKAFNDGQFTAPLDEGWISGSNITMNLGYRQVDQPATTYRRGRIRNNNGHKPSFYNSSCILVASYRVRVTAPFNTVINTGGGTVTYTTNPPTVTTFTFPNSPVMVYNNYGICSNIVGVNALGTETNGTFGSGNLKNRGASANVPVGYTYNTFSCNSPQDYYYGIANNTGGGVYTTSNAWPVPDGSCGTTPTTHRVFTLWDVIGDHTGATNPTLGNPAADTTNGGTGGYMLIINAAYRIDSAFNHTIGGLCPDTYYEISCWMRNICSRCGCDSNGVGANGAGFIPPPDGDPAGVRPNLAIALDGVRYYTSGDLRYNGEWVKKGFTFRTGPTQTGFTMRFYNNAPGGGGNDWALDDISIVTCSPEMNYGPSHNPIVCDSNSILLTDTIRSYFDNYVYYKWQRSADGGATWSDVTGVIGPATPTLIAGEWTYIATYTVPPNMTYMANANDVYRVVVATTDDNVDDPNCRFTDAGPFITLNIIECGDLLNADLLSFSGKEQNAKAVLNWITSRENEPLRFEIEKSTDGINFTTVGVVNSHLAYGEEQNHYSFTDPAPLNGRTYYRIKMKNANSRSVYSRTIQLSGKTEALDFLSVINPFSQALVFEVIAEQGGRTELELYNATGKLVKKTEQEIAKGISRLRLDDTSPLSAGVYFLRVKQGGHIIQKRVVKQ